MTATLTRSPAALRDAMTPSPCKRPPPPRSPLGDLTNESRGRKRASPLRNSGCGLDADCRSPATTASSRSDREEDPKVAVQRFSLVSRSARPRSSRASPKHSQAATSEPLTVPANLANFLGSKITICRCSDCLACRRGRDMGSSRADDGGDIFTDSTEQPRICRMPTEAHEEYELLLAMSCRFLATCPGHNVAATGIVSAACKREQSAYFILAPGPTGPAVVGYVAAISASDRVLRLRQRSTSTGPSVSPKNPEFAGRAFLDDSSERGKPTQNLATMRNCGIRPIDVGDAPSAVPVLLQVWVEAEYRRQGYASGSLRLLLRGHDELLVHDATPTMIALLRRIGFELIEGRRTCRDSEGRYLTSFARVCHVETDDDL